MTTPDDPASIEEARAAVARHKAAEEAAEDAMFTRNDLLREAYSNNPNVGPRALADLVGIGEATLRGVTRDLAEARRRQRGSTS